MTIDEIITVAENAGFTGSDLTTAVAVALAESGGNSNALGDLGIGQGSFGLWQINSKYHPEFGPDFTTLYDPQSNANAAYSVYTAAGNSFTPWSTFKTGSYQQFVSSVASALAVFVTKNPVETASIGTGVLIAIAVIVYLVSKRKG